jgi:hypothetical protein
VSQQVYVMTSNFVRVQEKYCNLALTACHRVMPTFATLPLEIAATRLKRVATKSDLVAVL